MELESEILHIRVHKYRRVSRLMAVLFLQPWPYVEVGSQTQAPPALPAGMFRYPL